MEFESIRDHFKNLMPANLCETSVNFFQETQKREELVAHLRAYHHWSIYKNLLTRENLEILGVEFGNQRDIFIDQKQEDIHLSGQPCFIFGCNLQRVLLEGSPEFSYFKSTTVNGFIDAYQDSRHFVFLQGNQVEELHIAGTIETLRIYDSRIKNLNISPTGKVKRLIFGSGGRIDNYSRDRIGVVVGD